MQLIQIGKVKTPKTPKQARELIGRFSEPSKMPCYAWSISAEHCVTGSKLAKIHGSVCWKCYALKGSYTWKSTVNAMERREETLANRVEWVENFILALKTETLFRWFDSGDLQSIEMLSDIVEIAEKTPHVKHWLPTKEVKMVSDFLASGKTFPENLTVRVSAYLIDSTNASSVTGFNSLVFSPKNFEERKNPNVFYCKAPSQNGECKTCRACWNKEVKTVAYKQH